MKQIPLPQNKSSDISDKPQSVWKRVYAKLTHPHPSITDLKAIREARLLSTMFLFTIVTTIAAIPIVQQILPVFINLIIFILILEVGGYLFSRTRFYRVGLVVMLVALLGSTSYSVQVQGGFTQFHLMAALAWLVLPIILASIFFNFRFVLILISYIIINFLLLPLFNPEITFPAITQAFFFVLTAAGLILLLTRHISQIEEDRLALLIEQQELLILSNRELQQEIKERLSVEKELEQSHSQLEYKVEERTAELAAANKDLETLLYVISHDLKEPLRSVRFFSEMVSRRYADKLDEKGQDWLRRINRGGSRLQSLISDIITLSHILSGQLTYEWVDGNELVHEAMEQLEQRIQETNATINIDPALPKLYVNRTWVIQAIFNLISNALKFTMENQSPIIEIAPYYESEKTGIVVRDRGIGISTENSERIFQLFQREVGQEIEGSGAGLAIVKQIAERHHGHAWVQSREGGGSEFFITFANESNHELS